MLELKEKIFNVMSAIFDIEVSDLNESSSNDNIGNWDSIRHLNLILSLEEEFNITIPDEETGNLINYKLIELIVTECMNN